MSSAAGIVAPALGPLSAVFVSASVRLLSDGAGAVVPRARELVFPLTEAVAFGVAEADARVVVDARAVARAPDERRGAAEGLLDAAG